MDARLTGIDRQLTLRYLQMHGRRLPAELLDAVAAGEEAILSAARPRLVWRLFDRLPDGSLAGTDFVPAGADVAALLGDARRVVLFAATLGAETEQLIRHAQARDMARAVVLDAAASAAIEIVCDNFCAELEARFAPQYLTERYSPGYGDMPLEQQADFCRVLDTQRRIGLTLSPGGVMLPQKSVTALVGLADTPQPRRARGCDACPARENCAFRKEGTNCGKE